jgi:hypothetical protein
MDEAGRIAAQRAREREAQAKADEEHRREELIAERKQKLAEIELNITEVLRLLADQGYPDVEEFVITVPRMFRSKRLALGAWRIGSYTLIHLDDAYLSPLCLLSNGKIGFVGGENSRNNDTGGMVSARQMYETSVRYLHEGRFGGKHKEFDEVHTGLHNLRLRLEGREF